MVVGPYTHMNRDFKDVDGTEIESYEQRYVYNNSHIDVYFEIGKVIMNMEQSTKHTARKTQIDRQVEKTTYPHDTNS